MTEGSKRVRLTKRILDSLPAEDRLYTVWDQELTGFGVRVMPSGQKSFVLKFTVNRQQKWETLGRFGVLTLEEGRKLAQARRGVIAMGGDPSIAKRAMRTAPTIKELIERFLEEHVLPKTKPSTQEGYTRHLRNVIQPRLGNLLVSAISPAEVAKFHHDLRETPRQANQSVAILRKMLNCAEVWKYRPLSSNPCVHIQKYPEEKRTRFLSFPELDALGETLAEMEREEMAPAHAVAAIRLLILTGARHSEILKLKWRQVDLSKNILRYNPNEHKTGGITGMKTIPLNAPALDILKNLPRVQGNSHVITGDIPGHHFVGLQNVWERVRHRVSERESEKVAAKKKSPDETLDIKDVRIHDLRHTFASVGVSQGLSLPVVGSLLGHSQPSVTQRYAHLAEDPRFEASEQIASTLARSLGTTKRRKKA